MDSVKKATHVGFIRRSGFFIVFAFISNVFEVGFNGFTVKLPDGGYETFQALFRIFFIEEMHSFTLIRIIHETSCIIFSIIN